MMKTAIHTLLAITALLTSTGAWADAKLAASKNCMGCHAVEKKILGPSYKDVAQKYKGQKDAADKLAAKIMNGGSGAWGVVAMPANAQVSAAEAKTLATWVLAQK